MSKESSIYGKEGLTHKIADYIRDWKELGYNDAPCLIAGRIIAFLSDHGYMHVDDVVEGWETIRGEEHCQYNDFDELCPEEFDCSEYPEDGCVKFIESPATLGDILQGKARKV